MVNEALIRPYFWGGTLEGCRLTSHVARAVIVGGRHCVAPEIAAGASAVAAGVAAGKLAWKRFFSARRFRHSFDIVLREARSDGFFRCLDCLVPVLKANFFQRI